MRLKTFITFTLTIYLFFSLLTVDWRSSLYSHLIYYYFLFHLLPFLPITLSKYSQGSKWIMLWMRNCHEGAFIVMSQECLTHLFSTLFYSFYLPLFSFIHLLPDEEKVFFSTNASARILWTLLWVIKNYSLYMLLACWNKTEYHKWIFRTVPCFFTTLTFSFGVINVL